MNKPHLAFPPEFPAADRLIDSAYEVLPRAASADAHLSNVPNSQQPPKVPTVEELRRLLQSPSCQQKLDELRRKIEDGSYLTRQAAEESASRLLDDGEM